MGDRRFFVLLLALAVCCGISYGQSTYRFQNERYEAYEGSERVRLVVERNGERGTAGSIRVSTFASSASAGGDYISIDTVYAFEPNVERIIIDITVINDNDANEGETFTVRLTDPTGGTLGSPAETIVEINDGNAPSTGLEMEVIIAIAVAAAAAVLILLVCCCLIYCLRFRVREPKEDVVYIKRPEPEPEPYPESYPDPYPRDPPRPYTPPLQRPYTPPCSRPRTPPPHPNTQVTVINEPSPPIIEPPPPKPTQVIVIRPQTPEIIRRCPDRSGTEVIVKRPRRPRSASPVLDRDRDGPARFDDDPYGSRHAIRKPVARHGSEYGDNDRYDKPRHGSRHRHRQCDGGRYNNSTLPMGSGLFGQPSFGSPFSNPGFGSPFGPAPPPTFGPSPFGGFNQPQTGFGPPMASFGQPSVGFGQRPPVFGPQPPPGFFGRRF